MKSAIVLCRNFRAPPKDMYDDDRPSYWRRPQQYSNEPEPISEHLPNNIPSNVPSDANAHTTCKYQAYG